MGTGAGADDLGDHPVQYALPPEPTLPTTLPSVVPAERVHALLDRLDAMDSDQDRVQAIRDELCAVRGLARYLTRWRSFYCSRMWLANVPTRVIAKAAGVRDTYVSRRAREMGYEPRRNDKRRDG